MRFRFLAPVGAVLGLALAALVAASPPAGAGTPPLDVLYVGNSLIGTHTAATHEDTPALVRNLAAEAGRRIRTVAVIHYGSTLQKTWDRGEVRAAVNGSRKYDFVVLQEYSTLVATDLPRVSRTLLRVYAPAIRRVLKPGGRVVLFQNWALANPVPFATRAANVAAIEANYKTLAKRLPLPTVLAPIGDEFEQVFTARGLSALIIPDGKHPNDAALYLEAVTLYGILFRESPRHLPDLFVPPATAGWLRDVAATRLGY